MVRSVRWKVVAYKRVVSRNNKLVGACEISNGSEPLQHVVEIDDDREGFRLEKILVVVRGIGGKAHPARFRQNAHRLKALAVATRVMNGDTLPDFSVTLMKDDAPGIEPLHRLADGGRQ